MINKVIMRLEYECEKSLPAHFIYIGHSMREVFQALENNENLFRVLRVEANAIITHGENPFLRVFVNRNTHLRRFVPVEFDRIANQVLEQLHQLDFVSYHLR